MSSIAELSPLLQGEFSVILQFRSNLLRDSVDDVCSSLLILQIFFGFPFGLDWSTGLHDFAPIQVDDWFRVEPYQNFSSPNFSCPFPLKPQRVFSEPCIHFVELSGLLYSGEVSCRSP